MNNKNLYIHILIIISTSVIHELSHIIFGGGFVSFEYAPERDIFSTVVITNYSDIITKSSGLISTLPFIFIRNFGMFSLFLILFQSRWDIIDIILL